MNKELANAVGHIIAYDIVSRLIDDVDEITIQEAVTNELPGLEEAVKVDEQVRAELQRLKATLLMRF